jgi:hypothetical protein
VVGNGGVGLVVVSIDLAPFGGLDFLPVLSSLELPPFPPLALEDFNCFNFGCCDRVFGRNRSVSKNEQIANSAASIPDL